MYQYQKKKSFAIKFLFNIHQAEKLNNDEIQKEYGFCLMDGHKEKIGNFKIEPPGLFRGRGDHPKQGMLKRRTQPEDVIINCSKYVSTSFWFMFANILRLRADPQDLCVCISKCQKG